MSFIKTFIKNLLSFFLQAVRPTIDDESTLVLDPVLYKQNVNMRNINSKAREVDFCDALER